MLILCLEKFPQFAQCFYDKRDQFLVNLLDLWLKDIVLDPLSAYNFWRKKFFMGTKFHELVFDRENCEKFLPRKIFWLYGI